MRIRNNKRSKEIIVNCEFLINKPQDFKGNFNELFDNNNPIHLEIGMGKGSFLLGMAQMYPEINFIGLERYDTIIAKAIEKIAPFELPNLKIIKCDALIINDIFNKEIETIYLNFSDPWPKAKHEKRRLTSVNFLKLYDNLFKNKKIIIQKTDNDDLYNFSLESLRGYGYGIVEASDDLHATDISNVMSEYEEKFSKRGKKINYLKAIKE